MTERKYDLYSHEGKRNIHQVFEKMRRDDPLTPQPGFDVNNMIWFASRYEDVEVILKDDRHFVRDFRKVETLPNEPSELERLLSGHMLNLDGEDHRRLRSLVNKAFTPKLVREMRAHIQEITDGVLASVRGRGEMDLVTDYAYHIPTIVIAELIGIPVADRARFRAWSDAFVAPTLDPEEQQKAAALLMEFVAYMGEFLAQRRLAPRNDLASALLQVEENGDRLSDGELFAMLILLIVAGHETTVNLIGNATLALLLNPDQRAYLQAHPEAMPQAVEEFLRYDSPVERSLIRFVVEDVEIGGQVLKKGAMVIPLLGSANRDEKVIPHAGELDIHRPPTPHLAFGKGVHFCLGAPLARLEAEIALNSLLKELPDLHAAEPVEELRYRMVPMFRGLEGLKVSWTVS